MKSNCFFLVFVFLLVSCGEEQGDIIDLSSEVLIEEEIPYLVICGQDTNHRGFAFYTLDGEFVSGGNFRFETSLPKGLTAYSSSSVLMSVDGTDAIYEVGMDGTKTQFHGSVQYSGNLSDLVISNSGRVYAVESNRIEVFDDQGVRLAGSQINTTTGSCTLSNPRGMTLNGDGNLVVVNQGGSDAVLTYDISGEVATCLSSVAFGNNPTGVLFHSDGFLYITTQGNNRVYRADPDGSNPTVVWNTNTALINNPTGIVELANGDLLVASSGTDTVERITTAGARVGTRPFIEDTHSLNISDMAVIGEFPVE